MSVGGHVERLATMDDARRFIADKAKEMSAHYVIRQNQPELEAMNLEADLPDAQISVWNTDEEQHWKARSAESGHQGRDRRPRGRVYKLDGRIVFQR